MIRLVPLVSMKPRPDRLRQLLVFLFSGQLGRLPRSRYGFVEAPRFSVSGGEGIELLRRRLRERQASLLGPEHRQRPVAAGSVFRRREAAGRLVYFPRPARMATHQFGVLLVGVGAAACFGEGES